MDHFIYTVYDRPRDFPDRYVVRRWRIGDPSGEPIDAGIVGTAWTLSRARRMIPIGHCRFARNPNDQRCIVETWV